MSNEKTMIKTLDLKSVFSKEDWTAGSWFSFLSVFLIIWIVFYFLIHLLDKGYEYVNISDEQLKNIVWLIDDSTDTSAQKMQAKKDNVIMDTVEKDTVILNKNDSTKKDTVKIKTVKVKVIKGTDFDSCKFAKAEYYLRSQYEDKIDETQLSQLRSFLCNKSSKEVLLFLTGSKLKVQSYFWLTGAWAYAEIILWVLIGVVCSLLYYVTDKNRNATTVVDDPKSVFDLTEIPYQIAKFFYAPLCTVVLVLGYSFLQSDTTAVDIQAGKGLIVFSFIAGFYSGRMMSFLDRLKELLLPLGSDAKSNQQKAGGAAAAVPQVTIELTEAEPSLTEEQKNHITEAGMGSAVVTLQAEGSNDVITAAKTGEEQESFFEVKNIAAGKYNLLAKYSIKIGDADIINLEAKQEVTIAKDTKEIKVNMLKAKADG